MKILKKICDYIFSIKTEKGIKTIAIFGVKITFNIIEKNIKLQNAYSLCELNNAESLTLFLVPGNVKISGGIMSIFSLCKYTREISDGTLCLISTFPGKYTYAKNDTFENKERVYRWRQIITNGYNLKKLILHLPEYYVKYFYTELHKDEVDFFKNIPHLQINILNQNILLMPTPNELNSLYKLTAKVTQTTAHDRYASQEISNKWGIPTHLFSVWLDYSVYKSYSFDEKEKIIVISPDENVNKRRILNVLKHAFPDFKLVQVKNLKFSKYMELISRAFFTVTFGEGMDGYYTQPHMVNSIGFAVYNDDFFPDDSWAKIKTIYKSYEEMEQKIALDMTFFLQNKLEYLKLSEKVNNKVNEFINLKKFMNNLDSFYKGKYHFYPALIS